MATTVTPVALEATITETINIGGSTYGNTVAKTTTVVGQADQRIMNIGTTETTILNLSTKDGAGQIVSDNLKYLRITNLDDTNSIQLCFKSVVTVSEVTTSQNYSIQLDALDSHVIMNNQLSGEVSASIGVLADCTKISAKCTVACDIEYLVITD
jgi:hypothetical protein